MRYAAPNGSAAALHSSSFRDTRMGLLQCGHRATRLPLQVPSGRALGPGRLRKHQGQSFFMRLGYLKADAHDRQQWADLCRLAMGGVKRKNSI